MADETDAARLKQLAGMVEDDCLIVTYKTLSRRLNIPVNTSKRLLAVYLLSASENLPGSLSALFCVSGRVTLKDGSTEEHVVIVKDTAVAAWQQKFKSPEKHVYSVQARNLEDSVDVYLADNPVAAEDGRALRATTSIQCHYVAPRVKCSAAGAGSVTTPVLTRKDLVKLEAESGKIMANIGFSVEALRLKPTVETPKIDVKAPVASWVKAGGLNPKKSASIKNLFEQKRKIAAAPKQEASDGEKEEETFSASKKNPKVSVLKTMLKNDEEDPGTPAAVGLEDVFMETSFSNQTLMFGETSVEQQLSPSPEQPVVIRKRGAVSAFAKEEPSPKKASTFCDLSNVSGDDDDDGDDDDEPPKRKDFVKSGKKRQARNAFDSDEEDEPENTEGGTSAGKWGFSAHDEGDSEPEEPTAVKRKAVTKRAKKTDSAADEEQLAAKTRKPRKKTKKDASDEDEDQQERPASPEKLEPIRQFLAPTPTAMGSGKQRKQVTKTSLDEEGYTVTEKVWVDADEEIESTDNAGTSNSETAVKTTSTESVVKKETIVGPARHAPVAPKGKKKSAADTKGKGVQASITSFFKKA